MSALAEHLHTLRAMWEHPRDSRATLTAFQNRKLARLLTHAYANVAHYRELFDRVEVKPGDVKSVQDLHRVPMTAKDDLRGRPLEETMSAGADPRRLVARMTSGSSGKPFTVRRSPLEEHLLNLFRLRALSQVGRRVSDRIARIGEAPLGGYKPGIVDRLRRTLNIYRDYHIDCFQSAENIARELGKLKPDVINGYPSALAYVASSTAKLLSVVQPRLVVTGGELLGPSVRSVIERGFGVPLFDFYSAHEFNMLAWECPQRGVYHVCDDNIIMEILCGERPAAEGETGEVVVTGLHSYTMPFIRYRTGDIATQGDATCSCGQPYSTLLNIQGRAVDYFRLAGDRYFHPYAITGPLIESASEWVFQHQMIQESEDAVRLKIAPNRPPRSEELDRLKSLGREKLGREIKFTVELVESFPLQSGKKFSPYLGTAALNVIERAREMEPRLTHLAEFSAPPEAILVHDPVAVGAFAAMEGVDDPARLVRDLLFRECPHALLYARQHRTFVELLREHVQHVIYLSEVAGDHESFEAAAANPNQVFTRDSIITLPWLPDAYITPRMAKAIRRPETRATGLALQRLGLREIVRIPEHLFLEGGDVIPYSRAGRRTLLVGYGQRTQLETLYYLQQALILHYADEIIGLELAPWRINLDGGFVPVAEDVIVADVESIVGAIHLEANTQRKLDVFVMLSDLGTKVIKVTRDQSVYGQACNCLCLGGRKVIYYDLNPSVCAALRQHDIEVYCTPGSELVKGRGGPRCMSRPIYQPPAPFQRCSAA